MISDVTGAPAVLLGDLWTGGTLEYFPFPEHYQFTPNSSAPEQFTPLGSLVYFAANVPDSSPELFVTDGTPGGTIELDINGVSSSGSHVDELSRIDDTLYFSGDTNGSGRELWKVEGAGGTPTLVYDLPNGSLQPQEIRQFGDQIVFFGTLANGHKSLWTTDGTNSGTQLRASFGAANIDSFEYVGELGNKLIFTGQTTGSPFDSWNLWSYDRVTGEVATLAASVSNYSGLLDVTEFDGHLVLSLRRRESPNNSTIFVSYFGTDGTSAGTFYLGDSSKSDTWEGTNYLPAKLADGVLLNLVDPLYGSELYLTDGTSLGTSLVADIYPGPRSSTPLSITAFDGAAYFAATSPLGGRELWRSDGTGLGTYQVQDFNTEAIVTSIGGLSPLGAGGIFAATDEFGDHSLWFTDGTTTERIDLGTASVTVKSTYVWGAEVYFTAIVQFPASSDVFYSLWKTDGTEAGTTMLGSIPYSTSDVLPYGSTSTVVGGKLVVAFPNGKLFATDGTSGGTGQLGDFNNGSYFVLGPEPLSGNAYALVSNVSGTSTSQLLRTDGTPAGTSVVKSISNSQFRSQPVPLGTKVYFTGDTDGNSRDELWESDGTLNGTKLTMSFSAGKAYDLTVFNGQLYFWVVTTAGSTKQWRLWSSDGTAAGSAPLGSNIGFSVSSSTADGLVTRFLTPFSGRLYFPASEPATGLELWSTDGTLAGTQLLADLRPGANSSSPIVEFGAFAKSINNERLYFRANAPGAVSSLYQTDGTASGTYLAATFSSQTPPTLLGAIDAGVIFRRSTAQNAGDEPYLLIPNVAPAAVAGGSYAVAEGSSITFDASASSDPEDDPLIYSWDINGDGVFGDALGVAPSLTWAQLVALGIQDGVSSFNQVRVRVNDSYGGVSLSDVTSLVVANAAPTSGVAGLPTAMRDAAINLVLTATDPSPVDQASVFTFSIDWNGDGSDVQLTSGVSGLVVAHTFTTVGARTIKVTATDKDGGVSSQATLAVSVSAAQVDIHGDLIWTGTADDDHVQFEQLGLSTIRVTTTLDNGQAMAFVETFDGVTGIVKGNSLAGDDTLDASLLTTTATRLDGGAGNNTLYGGEANDILIGGGSVGDQFNGPEGQQGDNIVVGGAGHDTMYGNAINGAEGKGGNNILLGDAGDDTIYGNWTDGGEGGGRNILVGGAGDDILYDYKIADGAEGKGSILLAGETTLGVSDFQAVQSEWLSTRTYTERVDNISGTGVGPRENDSVFLQTGGGGTVSTDTAINQLWGSTGSADFNWFFFTAAADTIHRAKVGETQTVY